MDDQELIEEVAEKVMGGMPFDGWNPITDANHWMMIVERILSNSIFSKVNMFYILGWWSCAFNTPDVNEVCKSDEDSLGRAVCLTALKAVEGIE